MFIRLQESKPQAIGKELESGWRTEPQTFAQNLLRKLEFRALNREGMRRHLRRKGKEVREENSHKYVDAFIPCGGVALQLRRSDCGAVACRMFDV